MKNNEKVKRMEQKPGGTKTSGQKDFDFEDGPGLPALLKFLVKVSQPPKPHATSSRLSAPIMPENEEGYEPEEIFDPEEMPEPEEAPEPAAYDLPGPDPIEPESSGWIIWLAVISLAAFYWLYPGIK